VTPPSPMRRPANARVYDFPERRQRRYARLNDTWGRIVPVELLAREVGVRRVGLTQRDLWQREA
jgi:hypothetical protein